MNKPHRHIATFFDSNYLAKAIVTYESLREQKIKFTLYGFCFDDLSYEVIKALNFPNFIPIHTSQFENEELLQSKKNKDKFYEYYWSCKPYIIKWVMDNYRADLVTYIDCDFMFFKSPEVIFDEIGKNDVLIQPNNFSSDELKQFVPVGYYCSCFESFRNNKNGRFVLDWWHKKCMDWCKAVFEPGRFADQKYLDDWRVRFKKVREISNIGANLAPWSIQKYEISGDKKGNVFVNDANLIYFHYHSFKMNISDLKYLITGDRDNFYRISDTDVKLIYKPYIKHMKKVIINLKKIKSFRDYVEANPNSDVKLFDNKGIVNFSSYKEASKAVIPSLKTKSRSSTSSSS